jgi:hypothetical protein
VSETPEPQAEALSLEEVTRAAQDLATRPDAAGVAAAFLELVQRWAAPSAVLSAVRDPQAPSGYRLLTTLCAGSLTLGIEKTLARLAEDSPESLKLPVVLRGEEVPGIRVRDNIVVPWWCEADSGLLVLRGVPRPSRAGLSEALALVSAVVWPRLLGSPAARVEELLRALKDGASKLESEVGRQVERLQAAATPLPVPAAEPDPAQAARIAELEGELRNVAQGRDALAKQTEAAREAYAREAAGAREAHARELEAARAAAAKELEAARAAVAKELEGARAAAAKELEAARAALARDAEARDALTKELEAARKELETARRERDTAGLDLAAARQQGENARKELEAAREERRVLERDLDVARRELDSVKRRPVEPPAPAEPAAGAAPLVSDDATRAAINVAIAAVRRTAFVPPLLRVSIEEVAALGGKDARPPRKIGIALLDRDVVALEPIATELEAAGIEVRLANQPEELALLLRSPDAQAVDAVVCDVMSFRPDQNVAGLIRGWDKDRPGLSFYLSYDAQSPVELERARRTPMSLTAGHITRPLTSARLAETSDNLAKRLGRSS